MVLRDPERTSLAGVSKRFAFTIGICVTGSPGTLSELIEALEMERYPRESSLRRIVVVASECGRLTLQTLRELEAADSRVVLVEEERRRGKAAAINRIITESEGEFVVFVNADALPAPGAISHLLRVMKRDERIGMASGSPVIARGQGMPGRVLELMWTTHNECALGLSRAELSNHGTDELMVVRREAIPTLPRGLVNDGAYVAGCVRLQGFKVCAIERAAVAVGVPSRPIDIVRQRRRILYGHIQVLRLVGRMPSTAESLMLTSPGIGFGVLVRALAGRPSLILALPFAFISEVVSFAGAFLDTVSDSERHAVWERYAD